MLDPTLSAFLESWKFEATIFLGVTLAAVLYTVGLRRIWHRAGPGAVVRPWRAAAFATGLVAVVLALQSPIATFSTLLFSMHMVQHLLLTLIGAPLLVIGMPLLPMLWALPLAARRWLGRAFAPDTALHEVSDWLTSLLPSLVIFTGTIVIWHLPVLYDASLRSDAVHYLQHIMFFGTALLFWWAVLQPVPGRRAMAHGKALLAVIATTVAQEKFLGGLLTFAGQPLYPRYTEVPRLWGLSALEDQQLAGLIMMMGGLLLFAVAFTVIFFAWGAHDDREQARKEAVTPAPHKFALAPSSLALLREALDSMSVVDSEQAASHRNGHRATAGSGSPPAHQGS